MHCSVRQRLACVRFILIAIGGFLYTTEVWAAEPAIEGKSMNAVTRTRGSGAYGVSTFGQLSSSAAESSHRSRAAAAHDRLSTAIALLAAAAARVSSCLQFPSLG
jgi:hypothetical protein